MNFTQRCLWLAAIGLWLFCSVGGVTVLQDHACCVVVACCCLLVCVVAQLQVDLDTGAAVARRIATHVLQVQARLLSLQIRL